MKNKLGFLLLALCSGAALAASHSSQTPTSKQARELLATVCRGGAATGACTTCPDFVGEGGLEGTMTPEAVTYGKFLNNKDTYALLDLSGCEAHVNNFGGSVLLRWRGLTRWDFVKYLPGLRSGDCLKYPALNYPAPGGRETLLCEGGYAGMGIVDTSLFPVDLARYPAGTSDQPDYGTLFILEDSTQACLRTASVQTLLSWQQVKLNGDALPDLRVKVRSGFGKTGLTPEQCGDSVPGIPTRAYTLDYLFDGRNFVPTQATRAVLKQLLKDNPYLLGN
ncbi:hypothetical protein [Deinococcus sp.]|uniref:hypothetical protein n=1 Tax=Deinococcus sp. TaxID=47478 RepID=UPI003CC53E9F